MIQPVQRSAAASSGAHLEQLHAQHPQRRGGVGRRRHVHSVQLAARGAPPAAVARRPHNGAQLRFSAGKCAACCPACCTGGLWRQHIGRSQVQGAGAQQRRSRAQRKGGRRQEGAACWGCPLPLLAACQWGDKRHVAVAAGHQQQAACRIACCRWRLHFNHRRRQGPAIQAACRCICGRHSHTCKAGHEFGFSTATPTYKQMLKLFAAGKGRHEPMLVWWQHVGKASAEQAGRGCNPASEQQLTRGSCQ